jgi:DNA invertase Pin-like site-specific DNA recombinase
VGYLRVVEIALLHSRRWANRLVLTAATPLIARCASPALAQAGDARPASTPTVEAKPLPSDGSRGQPIRRPCAARSSQPTTAQPPDGAAMRLLPLALAGLALLTRAARRRRVARGPRAAPVAAGCRLAASSHGLTAIGYARGRDAAEFKRHKAVIERACSQRGWTLASLVRDSHPAKAGGRKRSGLAYALEQLANGDASRLVTRRLDHLARSPRRLGALLEWCAGHGVDPVAVDVGLDTSTHDGRLVAGRLLAAARNGGAHDARRTAPRRRRADTRNGSRDKRDEPIAAPWRRKRQWR